MLLISGVGWISPQAARTAGASGFVSKDWSADEVAMAVRMVGKGMTVFGRQEEAPGDAAQRARARGARADRLRGAPTARSPQRLYLSPHTVKEHASSLYRKLGVKNRAEAARRAERLGLTAVRAIAPRPPAVRPRTPRLGGCAADCA